MLLKSRKQFTNKDLSGRILYLAIVLLLSILILSILLWIYQSYRWLQPPPAHLSEADRSLIDNNQTGDLVMNVSMEPQRKINSVVYLTLTNNSSDPIRNVRPYFYNPLNERVPAGKLRKKNVETIGIDIPAGESKRYNISLTKEYAKIFNPEKPSSDLEEVSFDEFDDSAGILNRKMIAGCTDKYGVMKPCTFKFTVQPTVIWIRYGTLFGERSEVLTSFYNKYIGDVDYNVPSVHGPKPMHR